MMVPAFTVNVAVVAPAGTVTEAGVVRRALLSERVTVVLAVAAFVRVTVQLAELVDPRVVGVQANEESVTAAARLTVAVCDAPPRVAVTVTD